eukprot:CAMPEP_0113858430 /NCGR_PEP_ID=MMETSP0372-20130328/11234_1 /TAXON_ID=340204 /ORGANISM="Lankesteria abbotti" /LENGTH=61 /DNA_ID=CAMNT_0000835435 /DNA_START=68 /DNA_END=253 /DNA_ORIENTATION=- /assembly_acc=CAM_ASM_000359
MTIAYAEPEWSKDVKLVSFLMSKGPKVKCMMCGKDITDDSRGNDMRRALLLLHGTIRCMAF